MADRPGFMVYFDFAPALGKLSDEEAGALFKAIMEYASTGQIPTLNGICEFAFEVIRPTIDRDSDRYNKIVEKRRKAAEKKWEKKAEMHMDANASKKMHMDANASVVKQTMPTTISTPTTTQHSTTTTTTTTKNIGEASGPVTDPDVAAVVSNYLDRINPVASPTCLEELSGYAKDLGKDVCLRALDIAVDVKKTTWPYIRAILQDKQRRGIKSLAAWDASDAERTMRKDEGNHGSTGKDSGEHQRIGRYL